MVLCDDTIYQFFVNGDDQSPVSYHLRAYGDLQRPAFVVMELPDNQGLSLAEATTLLVSDIADNTDTIYKVPQNLPDLLWFEQSGDEEFQQVRFVAVEVDEAVIVQEAYRDYCPPEAVLAQLGVTHLFPPEFSFGDSTSVGI